MENTDNTPNINLQDLVGIKSCIEVACSRGAFRAEEMKSIGHLYDRLAGFLKSVEPQVQPAAEPEPAPAAESSSDPTAPTQGE